MGLIGPVGTLAAAVIIGTVETRRALRLRERPRGRRLIDADPAAARLRRPGGESDFVARQRTRNNDFESVGQANKAGAARIHAGHADRTGRKQWRGSLRTIPCAFLHGRTMSGRQ